MLVTHITTERLLLRPFRAADLPAFRVMAGDFDVARMTSDMAHPLDAEQARLWLVPSVGETRFAIEREARLMGGVGYFKRGEGTVELGFWLGRPYWHQGYATEAARAIVAHGFADRSLDRFISAHFDDNPASGRVLAKLGFKAVGRQWMWCAARHREVDTVTYALGRPELAIDPAPGIQRASSGRSWTSLLNRTKC